VSLVFAGICSHAPGITGRAHLADPGMVEELHRAYRGMAEQLAAAKPDALIIIAAEHFANFFMNNMPAFAVGMADGYQGPIEDPQWLGIKRTEIPGAASLSLQLIREMLRTVDLAYAEEWKFDHGIMVPLSFLTPRYDLPVIPVNINCQGPPLAPLHRVWALGEALRRAADLVPQRIALIGTGGISHWPATPDSGKINEQWDREFLARWQSNDRPAMLSYTDEDVYRDAGQGGFEIRTFISVAAAACGQGRLQYYRPIPIFAVGCTVATMSIGSPPCRT
jgi:2,3-dihydroxyphenylpropionate 1,2-dioxygenase